MTTIRTSLQSATAELKAAGIPSAQLDARLLLQHVLDKLHEYVATNPEHLLTTDQMRDYEALIARRAAREPIACIIGSKEFYGLEFRTSKDTLDPRPDTETLVEAVLSSAASRRASMNLLDLGTGTGCILLTLLHLLPDARGVGVDASPEALAIAQENAERLGLTNRVQFVRGNWAEGIDGPFDIIVSNPPYIPSVDILTLEPEVREYDPMAALDGGRDGLDCYKALLPTLQGKLKQGGLLLFEFGQGQEHDVAALVEAHGYKVKELRKDLAGVIRCLVATAP